MAIDALVKPLLSLPLFVGLKPLQLTEIVRRAERIVYRPGDVIVAENAQSDAAIVVISGTCLRLDDNNSPPHGEWIPAGSIIAELGMLVEVIHPATIIAREPVRALRLTRTQMLETMQNDPTLAEHFSSLIAERLHLLAEELSAVDLALSTVGAAPPPQMLAPESRMYAVH